jgi:hypothetical protein
MSALSYYENISFEEKINDNYLQVIVTVSDKKTETTRIIFNQTMPVLWSIPLFIILVVIVSPFLALLFLIKLTVGLFSLLKKEKNEPSYQETKDYFNSGKGYLNNLSDEDKKKLLTRKKNIPFGL